MSPATGGPPATVSRVLRHNMRVRKVLIGVAATAILVAVVALGAIGVDYGTSIYAEYRLSSSVRRAADLGTDPFVAIVAFPFLPQALRGNYNQLEIKANAVSHAMTGKATLEATMYSVDLAQASWLIAPDAKLAVRKLESRIIIDSTHLGRYLNISDLMAEAPPKETNTATGASPPRASPAVTGWCSPAPQIGRLRPPGERLGRPVHRPDDPATLVFTPTGVLTGSDTADQSVPADKHDAVLHAFSGRLPNQRLPFGVAPTTEGARGSDVIIEGITYGVTVTLEGFKQS